MIKQMKRPERTIKLPDTIKKNRCSSYAVAGLLLGIPLLSAPIFPMTAFAQNAATSPDKAIARCAAIGDDSRRLACYDAFAKDVMADPGRFAAQAKSQSGNEPEKQAQQARKDAFGLPPVPATAPEDTERHTKIAHARQKARGFWVFTMENGQIWEQTDTARMPPPSAGDDVKIAKSALGSFFITINGRNIRAKRIR